MLVEGKNEAREADKRKHKYNKLSSQVLLPGLLPLFRPHGGMA